MNKPRLLDLFCGAGGAAMGYHRAGFDVVGIDIKPQPRYPFEFVQADALEYAREHGTEFDAIHASPPCQGYSNLKFRWGKTYDTDIEAVRSALKNTRKPYAIENVERAPLLNPVTLCGSMFNLRVIRHRVFECDPAIWFPPGPCQHPRNAVGRRGHLADREWMTVTGHFSNIAKARLAMGIEWMTQSELSQAIPPAYTEFIGRHILSFL